MKAKHNINLIPWPQVVEEAGPDQDQNGNNPFDMRKRAYLVWEAKDNRLKACAHQLFADVIIGENTIGGGYLLASWEPEKLSERFTKPAAAEYWKNKADGYSLVMEEGGFCLRSLTPRGFFYGMQTLRQLFTHDRLPGLFIEDWSDVKLRADYLDLRNIFPPFERILFFIRELAKYKINALVIEYEDKLPFQNMDFLRHEQDCFTPEQFEQLIKTAKENFIDIIPLQQSFGHLEYVLKFPQYQYLRETKDNPGEMCPLRAGAKELAFTLLEEMARLHPDSRYLHIGCDEVWSLGQSEECRMSGKTRERIFIEFVNQLIDRVCALGKIPLIWHDMFAHASMEELELLDKRVVVVIWLYSGSNMPCKAKELMKKLSEAGIAYLGGSSVRCWDNKPEQNYPVIENRLQNLNLWADLAKSEELPGLIHTNWASSFSFGRPYGLFETSRYPLVYAADISWKLRKQNEDFLYRFLWLYHGMDGEKLKSQGYENQDYYKIMHEYGHLAVTNQETARLISLMIDLENSLPVWHTMFRCEMFPDSEVEYACLKGRTQTAVKRFRQVEKELAEFVPQVLDAAMGELFTESRLYLFHRAIESLEAILKRYEDKKNEREKGLAQ